MKPRAEIVGWVCVRAEAKQVLLKTANGGIFAHAVHPNPIADSWALQTGTFRRARPVFDERTRELVRYEIERIAEVR